MGEEMRMPGELPLPPYVVHRDLGDEDDADVQIHRSLDRESERELTWLYEWGYLRQG
jgi:hypothetical protein